jgi:hypothetical protein
MDLVLAALKMKMLSIETNVRTLNVHSGSNLIISGNCDERSQSKLVLPIQSELSCFDGRYTKTLDLSASLDGKIFLKIESRNSMGNVETLEKIIQKDMVSPILSIQQPTDLGAGISSLDLSGTCSENGEDVKVLESSTGLSSTAKCLESAWTLKFNLGADLGINTFIFSAKHLDLALNEAQAMAAPVARTVLGDFSINGVSHLANAPFNSTLRTFGSNRTVYVEWTPASNVQSFSLEVLLYNLATTRYDISLCQATGIPGTVGTGSAAGCNLTPGTNYQVVVTARNTADQLVNRTFNFASKSRPKWRSDSINLFINTSVSTGIDTTILYSDLIEDYLIDDAPFTFSRSGYSGEFSAILTIDNANQKIVISPGSTKLSGRFSGQFEIADVLSNTSLQQTVTFNLTLPHSWIGAADNNFNNPLNWCGSIGLRTGCRADSAAPDDTSDIMIDNLCQTAFCDPSLTLASTVVHSFYLKANSFKQNGYSLTIGNPAGYQPATSFYQQTGGIFNSPTSSGMLSLSTRFAHLAGDFYAPHSSDFLVSSQFASNDSQVFQVDDGSRFFHNDSNLTFIDPTGRSNANLIIKAPTGVTFKNLKFDSDGSSYVISSPGLTVSESLDFKGRNRVTHKQSIMALAPTDKIIFRGDTLECSGQNAGGNIPIYVTPTSLTALYKVTNSDCRLPPLDIRSPTSPVTVKESPSSTHSLRIEALIIGNNTTFIPPDLRANRDLIIAAEHLVNNSYAFKNLGTFDSGESRVIFQNGGDGAGVYFIDPGVLAMIGKNLIFEQLESVANWYKLVGNTITSDLQIRGLFPVKLKGFSVGITSAEITLGQGFELSLQMPSLTLSAAGISPIVVNTTQRINIEKLTILRSTTLSGSSSTLNLSGALIELGINTLSIPNSFTFQFLSKSGVGTIDGGGSIIDVAI